MKSQRKTYQAPQLRELGSVTELTQQYGLGFSEWLASIVTNGAVANNGGSIFNFHKSHYS